MNAVVGGGGLLQLPAPAIAFPGASPVQILATTKLVDVVEEAVEPGVDRCGVGWS